MIKNNILMIKNIIFDYGAVIFDIDHQLTIQAFKDIDLYLYKCVQAHNSQSDWQPPSTPALWTKVAPDGVIPVWVQPTGAQDAYQTGDKVHFPTETDDIYESVIDANVCRKIVRVADVKLDDIALEIGPGLGSLTLALLEEASSVVAIEIDQRLATQLPITAATHSDRASMLTVINSDALAIRTLDVEGLQRAIEELGAFENARSGERRSLFDQIDALTAELVKRYKDDGANIDALLNDES